MNPETESENCRPPSTPEEWERYFDLRWDVLRRAWDQPRGTEKDELESTAQHAAIFQGDRIVAIGRLHRLTEHAGQVRYMAVHPDSLGRGLGARVLRYLEDEARELNLSQVELDARESAVGFYEKQGFKVIGDSPAKWGIRHQRMSKTL